MRINDYDERRLFKIYLLDFMKCQGTDLPCFTTGQTVTLITGNWVSDGLVGLETINQRLSGGIAHSDVLSCVNLEYNYLSGNIKSTWRMGID